MAETLLSSNNPLQKLRKRYIRWSLVLIVMGILIFSWNLFVVVGVYNLDLGYRWAYLTMTEWMYVGWGVYILFIMLELVFFSHYYTEAQKQQRLPAPGKPMSTFKGKNLLVYTYPTGSKGGVFSKTHVQVDKDTIVNVRVQLLQEEEVWP